MKPPAMCSGSFRCCLDGALAGTVELFPSPSVADEYDLVVTTFVGALTFPLGASTGQWVRGMIERGDARELHEANREFAPFFCPDCVAVYCGDCWTSRDIYAEDFDNWFEESRGVCPRGHERLLVD